MRSNLVVTGVVLVAVCTLPWWRINISPSVPLGLYWLRPVTPPLHHGMLVLVPVPPGAEHWAALPLLKPVAGLPGEEVCVDDNGLWVAGESYGPILQEAHGMLLPQLQGCFVVQDQEVFLASRAPRSFDGRYWGSTPLAELTARATPLLTWR